MPERPRRTVEIREFPGYMNNVDSNDLPPGAAEIQINVHSIVEAELSTRLGYRHVTFEN